MLHIAHETVHQTLRTAGVSGVHTSAGHLKTPVFFEKRGPTGRHQSGGRPVAGLNSQSEPP
jgi:hypothetical protein